RNHRRHGRLAHAERALRIGADNMNFDCRRVAHARNCEISKCTLLSSAAAESNFSFQRRRNSPDNSAFHLLFDADGIDDASTINRRNDALHMNIVVVIETQVDDISNVSVTEVSVARHTTSETIISWRTPV